MPETSRPQLTRTWSSGPRALWIGHSPSTADAVHDDPTVRRVTAFTRAWGLAGLDLLNLFCWRATRPADVVAAWRAGHDVVGPLDRDARLTALAPTAAIVVVAWGALPRPAPEDRAVAALLAALGVAPRCLGRTATGDPRHPLYVAATTGLEPWELP